MEKRNKKRSGGMGFYIALCCCVTILGIVGYINNRASAPQPVPEESLADTGITDGITDNFSDTLPPVTALPENDTEKTSGAADAIPPGTLTQAEIFPDEEAASVGAVPDTAPPATDAPEQTVTDDADVTERGEDPAFYDGPTVESVAKLSAPSFVPPLNGRVLQGFEDKKLLYNPALGDWRTHTGIDIEAAPGAEVCAACGGEIMDIYDSAYGTTVVMTHDGGYKTLYSNIVPDSGLETGKEIAAGEKLAVVSSGSSGEAVSQAHIHFEIIKDGEPADPEDYIDF